MSTPLALNATELGFMGRNYKSPFPTTPNHPPTLNPTQLVLSPSNLINPGGEPVNKLIYAGFLEHLGRCIYGGIVDDPKEPSDKKLLIEQGDGKLGVRKDVVEVLGAEGELAVPMLRWPGGNFVSNYHWQDAIGPVENRPKRIELAWLSDESNMFGTDEFIDYCRLTKCEPYICLNMGTGTYEEALAWVEYCNGTGNTHWASLRRKHTGRDEPHNVKYWGLGNEVWGPWQVGNMKAADYAEKARQWAHGLKLVDPTIKLVSCGHEGNGEWDSKVLQTLAGWVDLHSIHLYTTLGQETVPSVKGLEYENNVFGPAAAERNIEICKSLIDLAQINRVNFGLPARPIKIAFDEWNVWDELKGHAENGLAQVYDYSDMLGFVAWLNVLVRKHDDLGLACLAQSVNVISPLTTSPNGILRQTIFHPLKLFSNFMRDGHLLSLPSSPDRYVGPTYPVWIQKADLKPAYIDTVAMITADKKSIRLSILNRHPSADFNVDLRFDGFEVSSVEVHEMYSDDLSAVNSFEKPDTVVPNVRKLGIEDLVKGKTTVKKHSWSFFIIEGTKA